MTRSSSRVRTRAGERGIILIVVVIIAILYFALIELMLIESSEASRQAERYRARVTSFVLAENGAELACEDMVNAVWTVRTYTDDQGTIRGEYKRDPSSNSFELTGKATTAGVVPTAADVKIQGSIGASSVRMSFTTHSP